MLGPLFDFLHLPTCHTWRREIWTASGPSYCNYSLTAKVTHVSSREEWSITSVYGPQADSEKILFLDELRAIRSIVSEKWRVWWFQPFTKRRTKTITYKLIMKHISDTTNISHVNMSITNIRELQRRARDEPIPKLLSNLGDLKTS